MFTVYRLQFKANYAFNRSQSKTKKMKYATHYIKEYIKFSEKSRKITCVGVFFVYLHAK